MRASALFAGGRALTGGAHLILHKGSGAHSILRTVGSYSVGVERECVLFIGTRFSKLYSAVHTPAEAA